MAFNVPNFGGANLAPHVGGGRSHGAGLQTAMFILNAIDRFTNPDPDLEKEFRSAAANKYEPGYIEDHQPAVGPVRKAYDPAGAGLGAGQTAPPIMDIGKTQAEDTTPTEAPRRSVRYRGRELNQEHYQLAEEARRLDAERGFAYDEVMTKKNEKTMSRFMAADKKAREAQSKLESVAPQLVKFNDTLQSVPAGGGEPTILASDPQKTSPGQGITTGIGTPNERTTFPAGTKEQPDKAMQITHGYDEKGREYYDKFDRVTGERIREYTGTTGKPPGREDSGKVHHSELVILRDKDGKPLLDENGAEKIGRQWFDAHNAKVGQPQPVEVDATGKVRKGPDKIQAELAKNYDKVQIKAKDWEDAVQNPNNVGLRLINPKDGLPYLITRGGHGNVAVKVSK